MDMLLISAYVLAGTLIGFLIGLFVRRSYVEPRPPQGGEPPVPSPWGDGPSDWSMWEEEITLASA